MRIRFQSVSNRLKLMSWYRSLFKSSLKDAKTFVNSIPCEISISDEIFFESYPYLYKKDIEKQLKNIADFEILPDLPEIRSLNENDFKPTCGCEYQPQEFFMTYYAKPLRAKPLRAKPLRSNIDYYAGARRSLIISFPNESFITNGKNK